MQTSINTCVAFVGHQLLARGELEHVALAAKRQHDRGDSERIACFDDESGLPIDLDLSGSLDDVRQRALLQVRTQNMPPEASSATTPNRSRGRPRLGVISREVSLLPRHWSWLAEQRGGASATLRRLVDIAKKQHGPDERVRRALDAAHRFMWDMAGNQPDFEEATRALFARDFEALTLRIASWPQALREQVLRFIERAR